MDRSVFTLLFPVLFVAVVSAGTLPDQEYYWKKVLPNTPIPGIVRDLLHPAAGNRVRSHPCTTYSYNHAATEDEVHDETISALFFFEKDLHPGAKTKLHFVGGVPPATFIPRAIADAIPFSSKKLPEILTRFSLKPNSMEAEEARQTLQLCEDSALNGETKHCATSLESMVDFATSTLGTHNVRAVSTEVGKEGTHKQQYYTVASAGVERLEAGAGQVVACHVEPYPYAVFLCHVTSASRAYVVPLIGEDGSKVTAVAVCHVDTSAWNPRHMAFQVLKVKPGTMPVCHFLLQDSVIWAPSNEHWPALEETHLITL